MGFCSLEELLEFLALIFSIVRISSEDTPRLFCFLRSDV